MLPVFYTDTYLEHQTGLTHPERPARLEAITKALRQAPFAPELDWRIPSPASTHEIQRVHPPEYIGAIADLAARGGGHLDGDTVLSPRSYEAACLAVGGWLEGVHTVLTQGAPAIVLCRPPGHHAEPQRGMGFCLFNNAAIAALAALDQPQVERVAILDWDVHHGNGTQAVVEQHSHLAYVSLHQWPLYPGTGAESEIGFHGNICNVPLAAGSGWAAYERAMTAQVLPFLQQFRPDLLLVSAGFDCAQGDPLAGMALQPQDFYTLASLCLELTPLTLFGLEGGYDLDNLAQCWIHVVQACLDRQKSVMV